jgi:hypothetical protein
MATRNETGRRRAPLAADHGVHDQKEGSAAMIRSRAIRLGGMLVAAAMVLLVSGCTVGKTTIPPSPYSTSSANLKCPSGVDLGPGHTSYASNGDKTYWRPGAGATSVRLHVTAASTTLRIAAYYHYPSLFGGSEGFGLVWDGTRSTGVRQVPLQTWAGIAAFTVNSGGVVKNNIDVTWTLTAVDAQGQDVGFDPCWEEGQPWA